VCTGPPERAISGKHPDHDSLLLNHAEVVDVIKQGMVFQALGFLSEAGFCSSFDALDAMVLEPCACLRKINSRFELQVWLESRASQSLTASQSLRCVNEVNEDTDVAVGVGKCWETLY